MKKKLFILLLIGTLFSCQKNKKIVITPADYAAEVDNVTQIMLHDIFSPPVASRIFVYPNIAAFEVMAQNSKQYNSLQKQLHGLDSIPKLDAKSGVNQNLAAIVAHIEVSKALVFSEAIVEKYRDSLYAKWSNENQKEFEISKEYGLKVADRIKKWMGKDHYKQTRTYQKYTVNANDVGRWQPTPPSYMDAIEPHWQEIRTLVMDTASQFKPKQAAVFSTDKNSEFYKNALEVLNINKDLTQKGDQSEEIQIAQFWDCNPYATVTQGHMTFAKKKVTPGGHWIGIVRIACEKSKADFAKTVYANTITSIGIFESFISCWDEKFRSNVIRPETYINMHIDENWKPLLQTPPFPEYTSGHSVVSTCSAVILTKVFGDNFGYADNTEVPFGLPIRNFTSFNQAAKEASVSRFYGGIHYKPSIDNGIVQGQNIGNYLLTNLKMIQ